MQTWLWTRRILCVVLLAPFVFGMGIDEQAFVCENAAAHLEECCPNFLATSLLCPQDINCGSEPELWLTIDESECIEELDCNAIVAGKVCERVTALLATPIDATSASPAPTHAAVCP